MEEIFTGVDICTLVFAKINKFFYLILKQYFESHFISFIIYYMYTWAWHILKNCADKQ